MGHEIQIRTDRDRKEYQPGDTVSGTVTITSESEWRALYAEVVLFWHTEGKGERDDGVVARLELAGKGSMVPRVVELTFSFQLPDMPWTYHGRVLKVHWMLGVYVKPSGGSEQSVELPLVMHSRPGLFRSGGDA